MLDCFQRIGQDLAAAFERVHCDHQQFPQLAATVLREARLPALDYPTLLASLAQRGLPRQRLDDRFSDMPIVLYQHEYFRIDLLGWLNATTSIHQHAFSGAFRVWQGSSVHTTYRFEETHRHNTFLRLGKVVFQDCELLNQGEVRTINPAAGLTHAVFHLDRPTYSLVARTHGESWNGPQFTLLPPAVAYAPDYLRQQLEPIRQLLTTMQELAVKPLMPVLIEHMPRLDTAVVAVYGGWWMQLARREACEDALLAAVAQHHGEQLAAAMPEAALRHAKDRQGHHLRNRLQDPDLRYFVAVLMITNDKAVVERMLCDRYPQTAVPALVVRCLCDLLGSGELPVTLEGEPAEQVVQALLEAQNEQAFLSHLSTSNPQLVQEMALDELFGLYQRIRSIPILSAVFQ